MVQLDPDALLEGLDDDQLVAVTTDAAPLAVIAGAGSGKTRVLTRRIAWRVATGRADAAHVLAVTFTRKAASELGHRLAALGMRERVASGTFHSVAYAMLRRRWADRGERPRPVVAHRGRLLRAAVDASAAGRTGPVRAADLAAELDWAAARGVDASTYEAAAVAAGRIRPAAAGAVARAIAAYETEKARRGVVDLDDLLRSCVAALEGDNEFATVQRWRFRHLFVDEFQDVNPLQFRLLRAWLGEGRDLCVVGDPAQAIYGWNGADPALLDRFPEHVPGGEVVRLPTNHRCSPQIVGLAAAALGTAPPPATAPPGRAPTVAAFDDEEGEAAAVAEGVRRAAATGLRWSSIAVLARTNAQLPCLERALVAAGVPVTAPAGGPLAEHPVVRSALGVLAGHRSCATAVVDLREAAADAVDGRERDVLLELSDLAAAFTALEPTGDVAGFAAWLAAGRDEAGVGSRDRDAVTVSTFHRAKGLEWPVVFVCGLEDGLVPSWSARTPAALEEERRLLHVALTRASQELHLSWARHRTLGVGRDRAPSPFLDDLAPALADGDHDEPPADVAAVWLARIRAERAAGDRPVPQVDAGGA